MHPAYSIIFFTVLSGTGLGVLAWLGVLAMLGSLDGGVVAVVVVTVLALAAHGAGLLASAAHLGRPERMLRAFTQWRSSWLSREAIGALAVVVVAAFFVVAVALGAGGWIAAAGAALSILSLLTIYFTSMIYASLKPVRQWHNGWVVPVYLALGIASGGIWLVAILGFFGGGGAFGIAVLAAVVLALPMKLGYWRFIDTATASETAGSATGLDRFGDVRLLDPPHTEENYLQREMGFRVARKHALELRRVAIGAGFVLPVVLLSAGLATGGLLGAIVSLVGALLMTGGLLIERWLFFAEATHTVTLYYGAAEA